MGMARLVLPKAVLFALVTGLFTTMLPAQANASYYRFWGYNPTTAQHDYTLEEPNGVDS